MHFHFEKLAPPHTSIIFKWLEEPHMREFWDTTPEHKEDILLFSEGRKKTSPYFDGIFTYWIGSLEKTPFCFILTAEVRHDPENSPLWNAYLSKTGKTYSLDFGIGNTAFLGKGFAAPTLSAFCTFFKSEIIPEVETFFIDPDEENPKAKHVYLKAGFKEVGTFAVSSGFSQGHQSHLMIKSM